MAGLTLLLVAPVLEEGSLAIGLTWRFFAELALVLAIAFLTWRGVAQEEIAAWLWQCSASDRGSPSRRSSAP
jgi:hypothetical protein